MLKTIWEVNALKLEENDILVGHGYRTASSEPYFFINLYTYTKQLGAIPVDLNGRCVVAEEIGDRDKDTMHPLKWKCTNECRSSISVEDKVTVPKVHSSLEGRFFPCKHL